MYFKSFKFFLIFQSLTQFNIKILIVRVLAGVVWIRILHAF